MQHLGGNIPFSSGMSKIFGEYDKDGKLIKSFEYEADKYSYRVMKYKFLSCKLANYSLSVYDKN